MNRHSSDQTHKDDRGWSDRERGREENSSHKTGDYAISQKSD